MRYWYDTEFYEDGERIHLISIGIVCQDGRTFYRENDDFDWSIVPAGHWIWENVYPHLDFGRLPKKYIAEQLRDFITMHGQEFSNELWGYYSAYDHVILAQLFGRMVDMPEGVPWFTRDIKQEQERISDLYYKHGLLLPKHTSTEHHALADAKWTKEAHEFLIRMEREGEKQGVVMGGLKWLSDRF